MNKKISYVLLFIVILIVLHFTFYFIKGVSCPQQEQQAHFRTNIFTNKCNFGGYNSCLVGDKWYYKQGCFNISEKEKEILINEYDGPKSNEEDFLRCDLGNPALLALKHTYSEIKPINESEKCEEEYENAIGIPNCCLLKVKTE